MNCREVATFLARRADADDSLDPASSAEIDRHLATCAACAAELDTQRIVASLLRARPVDRLSPQFAAQLAARLDQATGWLGIADWRAWTLRLAPVAAALALATYLGLGASSQSTITLDDWTSPTTEVSDASVLLESDISPDSVVETMLTGELPAAAGDSRNGR
jgi:anti-sigma factor RsiW